MRRARCERRDKGAMTYLELRDALCELGYDARLVNGCCYDIHQEGTVHYLSLSEATDLFAFEPDGVHPVDLMAYARQWTALNYWYEFCNG